MRRELGIEVDMIHGAYGEYTVLVDGRPLIEGGVLARFGVLPSPKAMAARVGEALGASPPTPAAATPRPGP